jgi:ribonuclease E
LIDASHPEETRVVVLDGQRVEEFDFEAASKRPLKGNIYLAKVTRVEPSLQAAFVEYGGNRQGFLAFSEIHPDYYQIPVADRMALLAEQEADARSRQEDDIESFEIASSAKRGSRKKGAEQSEEPAEAAESDEAGHELEAAEAAGGESAEESDADNDEESEENGGEEPESFYEAEPPAENEASSEGEPAAESGSEAPDGTASAGQPSENGEAAPAGENHREPEQSLEAKRPSQRWMRRRHYKIQEVIKRRQIILVQVVKEERGNKGAALTTYLSLAGRYCVLMPNTPRGGGISRKITNAADRKRLKSAAQALDLPEGMGLIIRTAGENRTKLEIKRDYEYLLRLWDTIRELTLKSTAPACVHEEGDLIKRAIRDLYNKDVTEVLVEGEDGYRNAKDFMRMLMPSHAKNVKPYKEPVPLFQRQHIEAQLDAMFSPTVTLKSGGYIVINQTEALVAIDVNSGRATREHSIEDTATKTNLEASDEIGRQLRLRDLAGLIVIDFIDMEDSRNDRTVEKRLHNAVKNDRARVQIGKISQFGLLEMSRQRLRAGVIAGSTVPCPHCGGQGIVRSVESTTLRVLRSLEEEAQKQRCEGMVVHVASDVEVYINNQKRRELVRLETDYDITITFEPKETLKAGDFEIDRIGTRDPSTRPKIAALEALPEPEPEIVPEPEAEPEAEEAVAAPANDTIPEASQQQQQGEGGGRRRRRRRRRGGRDRGFENGEQHAQNGATNGAAAAPAEGATPAFELEMESGAEAETGEGAPQQGEHNVQGDQQGPPGEGGRRRRRRRRRGRRGGRDRDFFGGEQQKTEGGEPQHVDAEVAAPAPAPAPIPPPPAPAPAPVSSYYEDRFGVVDEIDTTPREEREHANVLASVASAAKEESEAVPNAASTPVWTLEGESARPAVKEEAAPVKAEPRPARARVREGHGTRHAPAEAAVEAKTKAEPPDVTQRTAEPEKDIAQQKVAVTETPPKPAAEPAPAPGEPSQPTKRGWWQRAFRSE